MFYWACVIFSKIKFITAIHFRIIVVKEVMVVNRVEKKISILIKLCFECVLFTNNGNNNRNKLM